MRASRGAVGRCGPNQRDAALHVEPQLHVLEERGLARVVESNVDQLRRAADRSAPQHSRVRTWWHADQLHGVRLHMHMACIHANAHACRMGVGSGSGSGKPKWSEGSSMMAATTSRRDMALRRDCAMLALLALPRFLSTKACTARAHA